MGPFKPGLKLAQNAATHRCISPPYLLVLQARCHVSRHIRGASVIKAQGIITATGSSNNATALQQLLPADWAVPAGD